MRIFASTLVAMVLGWSGAAAAQSEPAPIRQFDIATTEQLGRTIYRQDSAAWIASDVLQAHVRDPAAAGLRGWIVEDRGDTQRVRFLRDLGHGIEAGYDVNVGSKGERQFSEPTERALTAEERAAFTARQTAAAHLAATCRPGYNSVVARDPKGDGWLVWLLAPMPKAGDVPVGGHYRFTISADGTQVQRADALSQSCLVVPAPPAKRGQSAALFVTHIVSPTPVETHVFLQLQSRRPMYVAAGGQMWVIDGGRISAPQPLPSKP